MKQLSILWAGVVAGVLYLAARAIDDVVSSAVFHWLLEIYRPLIEAELAQDGAELSTMMAMHSRAKGLGALAGGLVIGSFVIFLLWLHKPEETSDEEVEGDSEIDSTFPVG